MDTDHMLKRPKLTNSEDELFRMQEEFLRTKQIPSAKVINLRKNANLEGATQSSISLPDGAKKTSRFAELKKLKNTDRVLTSRTSGDIVNEKVTDKTACKDDTEMKDSVQNLPLTVSRIILGNIVEKVYNDKEYEFKCNDKMPELCTETGFPQVFTSDPLAERTDDKHSLFWQQVSSQKDADSNEFVSQKPMISHEANVSAIVEGSWATEIHKENLMKLNEMSQEEILQEKSKLEMSLDPNVIQFLKARKNKPSQPSIELECQDKNEEMVEVNAIESKSTPMHIDEVKANIPEPSLEILQQAKEQGWVHMDSVETEKLKWMELPKNSKTDQSPDKPYNARFDFNGLLLPYKDESIPIEKGLHHHGEEPERPGYSLQELLQLSRSSAQQQRCTALTTIANIVEKSRQGWYDKALEPPPLIALNERNILLLLRFSLDDTSVAIVSAALQALRAFLFSEADEVCLDRLFGFDNYTEPILIPPRNDVKDTSNLKDHELAQLDAVAGLCRTDIFIRIRYILSEMRPPPIAVNSVMEILIRLARRSQVTALEIAGTPYLLETIVQNFMPLLTGSLATLEKMDNAYGIPITSAVRFCRILTCYGGKSVAEKLDSLKIVQSLITYVSCDTGKFGMNLSIESMRLWKMLLLHDVAKDSVAGTQFILLPQVQALLSNHDLKSASELSCEYAAALIAVAGQEPLLKVNIAMVQSKWNAQLRVLSNPTWGSTKLIAETLLAAKDTTAIKGFSLSNTKAFSKLCSSSNLSSTCVPASNREPSSLPSLGVLTEDGELQPAVSHQSYIPFLSTALAVLLEGQYTSEIESILNSLELRVYLQKLVSNEWSLERSWYTRMELSFLTRIVQSAFVIGNRLHNAIMQVIWKIAVKLVSALPADEPSKVTEMLKFALSKGLKLEFTTNKLAGLSLDSTDTDLKQNPNYDVSLLYKRFLTSTGDWDQAAMPKDWLYLPVVHIYTKCKNDNSCNDNDKIAIITLLSLEFSLPDLVSQLPETLRFSRLILIYLCDTVYLSKDVSVLLDAVMSNLLRRYHKNLNFTENLPGLNSFTDLFTAMCEHFCSTSYGDHGFSMALLVPLAQRHDVHYRRLLWSEHAGSLRYLRLPIEKLVIPFKEYLYPIEKDTSLIESYITALVRGSIREEWCPIPYKIAIHHSAMYLKESSKLAIRMKEQVQRLPNKNLSNLLLNYNPSLED